jgi:hypothetical protein
MGPRLRGAVLAFAAAALLAAAAFLPWWSGPPMRYGQPVESMSVDVTLLGFHGCRGVGGAEKQCIDYSHTEKNETWLATPAFAGAAFATLGLAGLGALVLVVQGVLAQLGKSARRKLAVVSIGTGALVAIAAGVVVATAPDVHGVPRGLGTWFAFGGAGLAIVQAVIARLPERERPVAVAAPRAVKEKPPKPAKAPKPPKQPKPPKAAKAPKQPKQPPAPMPPRPSLLDGNYPGGPSPADFLALMEAPPDAGHPPEQPWEKHTLEAPGSSLPGPGSVLGTSMPPPNFAPMGAGRSMPAPPPMPATSDALAQTMVPRPPPGLGMPARPAAPMYPPLAPAAPPTAPTQAINLGGRPAGLPSEPVVMTMGPAPGPTLPPTVIPVPNLFGGATGSGVPPVPPEPPRAAPPPFRSGKTLPPPLFGKPAHGPSPSSPPPMPMPMPVAPSPVFEDRPTTEPAALDDDDLDSAATIEAGADRTDMTGAVPDAGSDPSDTGPLAEPPAPDDLDGRLDTASDVAETVERSPEEAARARIGIKPLFGDMKPRVVPAPGDHDETSPRERESSTAIASPNAMAKAGAPAPQPGLAHAATVPAATPTPPASPAPPVPPPPPRPSAPLAAAKPPTLPPPIGSSPGGTPPLPPPRAKPTTIPPIGPAAKGVTIPPIPKPTAIPPPLGKTGPLPPLAKPSTIPPPLGGLPPIVPPRPPAPTPPPLTTAAADLPPPADGQVATDGPAPACPQCDAPMSWVEKHLRFYCAGCRMYF